MTLYFQYCLPFLSHSRAQRGKFEKKIIQGRNLYIFASPAFDLRRPIGGEYLQELFGQQRIQGPENGKCGIADTENSLDRVAGNRRINRKIEY